MVTVDVADGMVQVRLSGWARVAALKSALDVPLDRVVRARRDPMTAGGPEGFRLPGSYLPRVLIAGSYRRPGHRSFWFVRDPERAVVVDLRDWRYDRLVLETAAPAATLAAIRAGMAGAEGSG